MPLSNRYFFRAIISLLIAVGVPAARADSSDLDAGIDIQLEHAHQEFSKNSANANTVDVAPHLQYGNWDFSLDAPWVSADANYVNNKFPSRLVTRCNKVYEFASKYPRLLAKEVATCQSRGVVASDGTVSGMSDISAFAHYGILLDDQGIWLLSAGAGYKFDNGDVDKNLGSGTRNSMLEATLSATYGWISGAITGGYAFVEGGDAEVDSSHYDYASFDVGVTPRDWVTLGCTIDYDQSYVDVSNDVTKVTAYVKFKPWQHVRLKVYTRDYGNADGYPDREYGGSMTLVY